MDKNIRIYYKNARAMGLTTTYFEEIGALQITLGKKNYYFIRTVVPFNGGGSIYLAKNKFTLNKLLNSLNYPVAKAVNISRSNFHKFPLDDLISDLQFPLVAKPTVNTARGRDVLCNIKNTHSLNEHLTACFKKHFLMQVEEFHSGLNEYRVLILKNKVIGVISRRSAKVIGDGIHTIAQLIDISNVERIRLEESLTISPLAIDQEYLNCLEDQNLTLSSIPAPGASIRLSHTANTGRGGELYSLGAKIHPENAKILCEVASAIGMDYVGFDIFCSDINQSFIKTKWLVIEANFNPDITLHELSNHGERSEVTKKILRQLIYRHPFAYLWGLPKNLGINLFAKKAYPDPLSKV